MDERLRTVSNPSLVSLLVSLKRFAKALTVRKNSSGKDKKDLRRGEGWSH